MPPPRAKYSEAEILECAFEILRQEGPQALTARYLGEKLGGSARPIFTVFPGMDDVRAGALRLARNLYAAYVDRGLAQVPPFKGVGMEYIRFAAEEPQLFRLLFMSPLPDIAPSPQGFLRSEENYERVLRALADYYRLPRRTAERLYRHLWIYCHGLAALMATGVGSYNPGEISTQMTEVFTSLLHVCKEDERND